MIMMRYIIQYRLDYEHIVQVGITAPDPETAKQRAEALFDAAEIWDDTPEVPLLYDDFEEKGDDVLEFTVEQSLDDNKAWPERDASVLELRRREAAFKAARLLLESYANGKTAAFMDAVSAWDESYWTKLNQAYEAAVLALGDGVKRPDAGTDIDVRCEQEIENGK